MFFHLYSKELTGHLRTFRFSAALLTIFVLLVGIAYTLGSEYIERLSTYTQLAHRAEEEQKNFFSPSQISPTVLLPPSPLSVFSKGEREMLGNSLKISRWQIPSHTSDAQTTNELMRSLPNFDLATVLALALSLFGILMSYNLVSQEKQTGTLRYLVLGNIKRTTILLVKFLAALTALTIPLTVSFLSVLLLLIFIHGFVFTAANWVAITLIWFTAIIYCAVFISLGLVASTIHYKTSSSLLFALVIWVVFTVLLPRMSAGVASTFVELHPEEEVANFHQAELAELYRKQTEFLKNKAPEAGKAWFTSGIGSMSPILGDAPPQTFKDTIKYIQFYEPLHRELAEKVYALQQKHLRRKNEQTEVANMLSILSPYQTFLSTCTSLSSTGYSEYERFIRYSQRYRQALINNIDNAGYFSTKIHRLFSNFEPEEYLSEKRYQQRVQKYMDLQKQGKRPYQFLSYDRFDPLPEGLMPVFDYKPNQPDYFSAGTSIGILALITAFFIGLAYFLFNSYDVR